LSNRITLRPQVLIAVNLVFWLAITVISATQLFVRFQGQYDGGWFNFFWRQAVVWVGWAALTPLVYQAIIRINNRLARWKVVVVHITSALLFTLTYALILSLLSTVFFSADASVWQYLSQNLTTGTAANLLVYLLIAFCSLLVVYYQKSLNDREQRYQLDLEVKSLEKQLISAQLDALKSQIRPHFLFNTLHSIASLIRTEELDKATETLAILSDLLRATLNNQEKDLISLKEELEFIQKYLQIEKIRFGESMQIDYQLAEGTSSALVPAFILQPLVENCFKHAFKDRETGSLTIQSQLDEHTLELTISDNGIGLSGPSPNENHHLGISNVKSRLNKLYQQSATLLLAENPGGGTIASLRIPVGQT